MATATEVMGRAGDTRDTLPVESSGASAKAERHRYEVNGSLSLQKKGSPSRIGWVNNHPNSRRRNFPMQFTKLETAFQRLFGIWATDAVDECQVILRQRCFDARSLTATFV